MLSGCIIYALAAYRQLRTVHVAFVATDHRHTTCSPLFFQAVQYARSVPRPTVHAHSNQVQNSKSPAKTTGASHGTVALPPRQPPTVDTVGIARLHERHREDKRSVELIGRRKRSPVRKRRQTGVGVSAMRVVSQVEER